MSKLWLPHDVIDDILVGLPVKALLRFRCLSKSICTTIGTPAFVAAHLNRSRQTKSHRKLVFSGPIQSLDEYNGIDLDLDNDKTIETHRGIKVNIPLESLYVYDCHDNSNRILASCNGVVLLFISEPKSGLALWNPFTRRWKAVPQISYYYSGVGLGYDSATNDYKIVTIKQKRSLHSPLRIEVRVFDMASNTLSSDVVKIPFPDANQYVCIREITRVGVFAMGALHWILRSSRNYKDVLSFDIARQKFVKMLPPIPPPPNGYNASLSLQGLEGGRILLVRSEKEFERIVEVFEVVDDGIGEGMSWRKLCKINLMELSRMIGRSPNSPILEDLKLLDYYKDGNKILLQYPTSGYATNGSPYLSHLFWYDLPRGTYNHARVSHNRSSRSLRSRWEATFCLESLVSLGADTQFDGSNLKSSV